MLPFEQWRSEVGDPSAQALLCREQAGLFDFSFMHIARASGPGAATVLTNYLARDVTGLPVGKLRYGLRLNAVGRILSDVTIWKIGENAYDVMSGRRQDITELLGHQNSQTHIEELSARTSIFSIQGPQSLARIVALCSNEPLSCLDYFDFCDVIMCGLPVRVGRLGYTGERGFEIAVDTADAARLWQHLSTRVEAAGFAAADILRIEAGFVLFCNEFSIDVTAQEAAMEKFSDGCCVGAPSALSLVCFSAQTLKRPVLWQHPEARPVLPKPGEVLVTSACYSPLAGTVLGLGYANTADANHRRDLVDPLGEFCNLTLCTRPFFDPEKRVTRGGWGLDFMPHS